MLKVAPMGLGMLITCQYMPDEKPLFCATAYGVTISDIGLNDNNRWPNLGLREWRIAAGSGPMVTDSKTALLYGNWTRVANSGAGDCKGIYVACDYSNLNHPVGSRESFVQGNPQPKVAVPWTRPYAWTNTGAPAFKTPRLAAGRALVSDCILRRRFDSLPPPGYGYFVHKDGYNVLYADCSASWYGDPQQQIIWYNAAATDPTNTPLHSFLYSCLGDSAGYSWNTSGAFPPFNTSSSGCDDGAYLTPYVHNIFNKSRGIDVNTPAY